MIIPVSPIASSGGSPSVLVYNMEARPEEGDTVSIPDSGAMIVNLLLWPEEPLNRITVNLPPTLPGRRVFLYADKSISEVDVVSADPGVVVRSGFILMNQYDQTVFNTVNSTTWARVATS